MAAVQMAIMLSEVPGPNGPITLFVSSVNDGYLAMVLAISRKLPGELIMFRLSRMDREYPGTFIQSYAAGQAQRTVYATCDENHRWLFLQQGTPLDFEELQRYLARRKKDRLNPDIISGYLQKLGYVSLEREFWISDYDPARLLAHKDFRVWCALEPAQH